MTRDIEAFRQRLAALGLRLPEAELPAMMQTIVELEAAARTLRVARDHAEEPACCFRLPPHG
ncbi:hypothetical protein [Pseudoroseomonas sp. WGS1072]|uniref:hypothetical protein n=1 Tax=Roseomonas sp. WGS1072 TaxID=3366816 RepID=UPI003BF258A6